MFFFLVFCSPRDSTGVLGVKMVESVLGGSPTNKESPLSNIESRLHGLKFDEKVSVLFVFVFKYQHVTHTMFNSISNSRTMTKIRKTHHSIQMEWKKMKIQQTVVCTVSMTTRDSSKQIHFKFNKTTIKTNFKWFYGQTMKQKWIKPCDELRCISGSNIRINES